MFSLIWLKDVLLDAGLKVSEYGDWRNRGYKNMDMGEIKGVLCHHTANPTRHANMPTLATLVTGRPKTPHDKGLPGPLAHLGLGRDGTYYLVAAGHCNHAGSGNWQGVTAGNTHFIGIEAENTGEANDSPWPAAQLEAYHHGVAAILRHLGLKPINCAGHREYALPPKRKVDPDFNMDEFRLAVGHILAGEAPPLKRIPAVESSPAPGSSTSRPTLRRGSAGAEVRALQQRLRLTADGSFGAKTEAALRAFQRTHHLVPDGIAGPQTWRTLDVNTPA